MKHTARYKHKVANLKSRPAYVKGAELLREIAGGKQWRIDAVLEAIEPKDWNAINATDVFKQAAMFGRLATIENISKNEYFHFDKRSGGAVPGQILAAFHVAVLHGHYKVADYLVTLGADPNLQLHEQGGISHAMPWAIDGKDMRKIDYLLKAGLNPGHHLNYAVIMGDKKIVSYLISKGADINYGSNSAWTPFSIAVQYGHNHIAQFLLANGADPKNSPSGHEAMFYAIERKNDEMVEAILKAGVVPTPLALDYALKQKHQPTLDLLAKYTPSKPSGPTPAP